MQKSVALPGKMTEGLGEIPFLGANWGATVVPWRTLLHDDVYPLQKVSFCHWPQTLSGSRSLGGQSLQNRPCRKKTLWQKSTTFL